MNKNFQDTASLFIVLSLFIHTISSKHDRDYNIQAEFNLKCFSHSLHASLFAKMSGAQTCTRPKRLTLYTSRLEFSTLFDLFRMSYSQIFVFPTKKDKCRNYIYIYSISISSVRTRNELSQESSAWCILLEYV